MKCRNFTFLPVMLAVFGVFLSIGHVRAGDIDTVELDLENALIIREIEMEAEPDAAGPASGKVSVEEPFDAEDAEMNQRHAQEPGKKIPAVDFVQDLKSRDPRWHVSSYKIRPGDNLWRIARLFGVSHRLIIRANGISDPDMLVPGMVIKVPNRNGIEHPVKKGDSIYGLAKKYHVPAEAIISHNRVNPRNLSIGKKLFIPDASRPAQAAGRHAVARTDASITVRDGVAFIWPIQGKITSGFGSRKDPFSGKRKFHCGIDISAEEGSAVRASADGTVIYSDWKTGYGKVVVVRHSNGYITVYAHNNSNDVQKGDKVEKGKVLAYSGSTGAVTGAHLHFEIRKYVTPLNPARFLH